MKECNLRPQCFLPLHVSGRYDLAEQIVTTRHLQQGKAGMEPKKAQTLQAPAVTAAVGPKPAKAVKRLKQPKQPKQRKRMKQTKGPSPVTVARFISDEDEEAVETVDMEEAREVDEVDSLGQKPGIPGTTGVTGATTWGPSLREQRSEAMGAGEQQDFGLGDLHSERILGLQEIEYQDLARDLGNAIPTVPTNAPAILVGSPMGDPRLAKSGSAELSFSPFTFTTADHEVYVDWESTNQLDWPSLEVSAVMVPSSFLLYGISSLRMCIPCVPPPDRISCWVSILNYFTYSLRASISSLDFVQFCSHHFIRARIRLNSILLPWFSKRFPLIFKHL